MSDDPIACGGIGHGREYVVPDLRCPDYWARPERHEGQPERMEMEVVSYDRQEGVLAVRCPGCGDTIYTNGTIPASSMKRRAERVEEPTTTFPATGGSDDDGQ